MRFNVSARNKKLWILFLTYRNQRNPPDRRKKNGEKAEYAFCLSFFSCFTASQMRSIYKVDHFPHSFSRCVGTSHPQYGPQVFFRCLSSESDTNENYDTTTLELYTLNALITDFVVYFKISYIAYVQTNIMVHILDCSCFASIPLKVFHCTLMGLHELALIRIILPFH